MKTPWQGLVVQKNKFENFFSYFHHFQTVFMEFIMLFKFSFQSISSAWVNLCS